MLEGETLLVFADDWGVHPSSTQHLLRRFLPNNNVIWVNTVGQRVPRWSWRDARKLYLKLRHWSSGAFSPAEPTPRIHELVLAPLPLGRAARWLNARILRRAARSWLAGAAKPPFILSTLPLTADLPGAVPEATYVYYVVDDYASWPGLGGRLASAMDEQQARAADLIVAASRSLADLQQSRARGKVSYLPHGVDVAHFAQAREIRSARRAEGKSVDADVIFFGALDERIDRGLLGAIMRARPALQFLLAGPGLGRPCSDLDARNVVRREAVAYSDLPLLLGGCTVALLPYVGGPFGERLSPLKVREALAAGLPVVATDVPELRSLPSGVYLGRTLEDVLAALDRALRAPDDLPALEELAADSWDARAEQLSELLLAARTALRPA